MLGMLAAMAAAGGALVPFAPFAVFFVGVAALLATTAFRLETAVFITGIGIAAMFIAVPAAGRHLGEVVAGLAAASAGMVLGISRRQAEERAEQAVLVQVANERLEVESGRAELLEERNRLARELHDILAHTLSALSLQLEALGSVIETQDIVDESVAVQLERTKRLVREGMTEARYAVRALRDDSVPVDEQLAKLCAERDAALEITGELRPMPPEKALALYRVAQEALTNAAKHAPGAGARVRLSFGPASITLCVDNPTSNVSEAPLARSGAGLGLQGIRERVRLLGGGVEAGPFDGGWRVEAELPA